MKLEPPTGLPRKAKNVENPPEKRNFTSADPLFGSEAAIGPWKVTAAAMRPEAICGDLWIA